MNKTEGIVFGVIVFVIIAYFASLIGIGWLAILSITVVGITTFYFAKNYREKFNKGSME